MVSRNVAAIADGPKVPRREGRTLSPDVGVPFEVVSDTLRHASIRVTMDV
jgi:predicted ABC-class ATPase